MNKIIIIFGLIILLVVGVIYFQVKGNQTMKTTGSVKIGDHTFATETVKDAEAQQIGLTKYNSIKEEQAMLFIFEQPGNYGFWMKNMKFSIDLLYINNDTIVSIVEKAEPVAKDADNPTIYQPEAPADKVLEINAGLVEKYAIKKGDKVEITETQQK